MCSLVNSSSSRVRGPGGRVDEGSGLGIAGPPSIADLRARRAFELVGAPRVIVAFDVS